jgi:hypothetical protein
MPPKDDAPPLFRWRRQLEPLNGGYPVEPVPGVIPFRIVSCRHVELANFLLG